MDMNARRISFSSVGRLPKVQQVPRLSGNRFADAERTRDDPAEIANKSD
jgi:hypothetical protein